MTISIFELFSIGVGPSSSHTVGPMRAAYDFVSQVLTAKQQQSCTRLQVELYGSLALTGVGHATDKAVLMGLLGETPEQVDPDSIDKTVANICSKHTLLLNQEYKIEFDYERDLLFRGDKSLPEHNNALSINAYDKDNKLIKAQTYFSIGGGFILNKDEFHHPKAQHTNFPYDFDSAHTLLKLCEQQQLTIAELMLANEAALTDEQSVRKNLLKIIDVMFACIKKGLQTPGILPGGLQVKRRAHELLQQLQARGKPSTYHNADAIDWLNMYAIAVNEENAAGGRIVTAPTNGAAGIIPAVLKYYASFYPDVTNDKLFEFLLTAGAIAILYKKNASISGAEVGCQGEVGVASSMAAAGLTAVLGGSLKQIENAAEIAMEHHLGMTCDPIQGLVQIPCIERNAMGSVKAVNAARLALLGDGEHFVPLDKVIATMKRTGHDMMTIYKETALGGLAVNVIEC